MLGHELRNPLAALSSAAALLQSGNRSEAQSSAAAAAVARQVLHMARLVDDLLDVSRATSGKIRLAPQPRNLAEIAASAMRVLRMAGRLQAHDVAVETRPVWVHADAARTEQIVSNLVENAVKYTPEGGRIAVRVFARDDSAVIEVEDAGVGIAPALLPRVFDLFVQGESSPDRSTGASGSGSRS